VSAFPKFTEYDPLDAISSRHQVLADLIDDYLPAKAKRILKLRYFSKHDQAKVAEMMGISQQRVSTIERNAIKYLAGKVS